MKILTLSLLFLVQFCAQAQSDTIITYYDMDWFETTEENHEYLRKSFKFEGDWNVIDYYKNGEILMTGSFKSSKELKKHGEFRYYDEKGNLRSTGTYKKNEQHGEWEYFHNNGKVSSKEEYKKGELVAFRFFEEDGSEKQGVYNYDVFPSYTGGMDSLYSFLSNIIEYPEYAVENNIQGQVVVAFVVEDDGSITNVSVVSPVHYLLDSEAERAVKSMPSWNPGRQHNRPIRTSYTLPVDFYLN